MKRWMASSFLVVMLLLATPSCRSAEHPKDRPAAVAGSFYPADSVQLTAFVDGELSRATPPKLEGTVVAIIAPHAGYAYSASVAANSYALIKGKSFKRVVLIGPSHVEGFGYTSIYDGDSYATPLGKVTIDREFARKLASAGGSLRLSGSGHTVQSQPEHALEVQLPFLQRALGDFKLVAVVMGDQSYQSSRDLGMALAKLLKNDKETLLVASSDLSHFHTYDQAVKEDHNLLNGITQNDFLTVSRNLQSNVWEACGGAPIVAVMTAAQRLGGGAPHLLKYANSGDVTGDKSRVVGYAALAITAENDRQTPGTPFTDADKSELLKIARLSVESAVRDKKIYQPPEPSAEMLKLERGAFVTLTKNGELRGCIGYASPIYPLYLTVRDVAALAALRDTRFPPVQERELRDLQYEVSVLSPFHRVLNFDSIHVGEHGLVVKKGNQEGYLLPQVPVEQNWDLNTFLQQSSLKAGLPPDSWHDDATDVFSFTAVVFSDHDASKKSSAKHP